MRQRPDLGAQQHRVVQPCLDLVARHIGGRQQHKGEPGQQRGRVTQTNRWAPQLHRLLAGHAITPNQQRQAGKGDQRIKGLPGLGTQPFNGPATPAIGQHARGVNTQKNHQTRHQIDQHWIAPVIVAKL